ncbi:MAG: hypothetical protein AB7G28_24745 [Pirellulales bacterium]
MKLFGHTLSNVPTRTALFCAASAAALLSAGNAAAQQGYGSYYGQNVTQTHGQLGTQSTARYLYDEYFYHRPSVSPYMNINRIDTMDGAAYQAYVRPELERREATRQSQAAYLDYRKKEGRVGDTRYPGMTVGGSGNTAIMKPPAKPVATPGAYHNHWYGGWKK